MGNSHYSICVLALLIHKVSLQVVGFFGGSVVLPCSVSDVDHKPSDITVHWRQNGSLNVFDIIKGDNSVKDQNPKFRNRVETFSREYEKGNFSLKLSSLISNDSGEYQCFITQSHELKKIQLHMCEEPQNTWPLWMTLVIAALCFLVILGFCIVLKKRLCKTSYSGVTAHEGQVS